METLEKLNNAMAYIENHLLEEIHLKDLSRIACCGEEHFKRMFSFLAGMPLSEYIRRRRLALGAALLQDTDAKVIDLALQLGYSSPDAFTKAFKALHGISPSQVKSSNVPLKAFPPMTFHLTIQGGKEMNYRIVEKEGFSIIGIKKRIPLIYEGVNPHMESMWASLTMEDFIELKSFCDIEPSGILCISASVRDNPPLAEGDFIDQYIGVATTKEAPSRWEELVVAPSTWAVFTIVGAFPSALQDTWARVFSQWFPSSGYESTGGPEILWNESPDTSKPDYKSELWIPVVKK